MKDFDTSRIELLPLSDREHDLTSDILLPLEGDTLHLEEMRPVAQSIMKAKVHKKNVILFMGGHVIRSGVQKHIIDLMDKKAISAIAMNGACIIHDFELALIGATTESVQKYIQDGRFGMWRETGQINDIINHGYKKGLGIGEAMGKTISSDLRFKFKCFSILAAAYERGIPVTVHVSIGQDIIHQHDNFDGAATGGASHKDFLTLSRLLQDVDSGVVMNFGSAVMAPEVFLKALSVARNIERQNNRSIGGFTTLVCDLITLPEKYESTLDKKAPSYYFRPYKTMLIRTLKDGGRSYYVKGFHHQTIPGLWQAIQEET